jgi:hypothetical protein
MRLVLPIYVAVVCANYWVYQALLGFTRNLTHLDGHVVPLVREGVTQPGLSEIYTPHSAMN